MSTTDLTDRIVMDATFGNDACLAEVDLYGDGTIRMDVSCVRDGVIDLTDDDAFQLAMDLLAMVQRSREIQGA